jgi:hypothetical protein
MLPQTLLGTGLIGRATQRFLDGCSVLLAIVSIAVTIERSVAIAWSGAAASTEIVDRTRKGDRLPLIPAWDGDAAELPLQVDAPRTKAPRRGLPDGCESLASSLTRSPVARIAGRCLS